MLLHASFGFEVWQIDRASADLPRTRQSAEHKMSHSRFGSSINEIHSLIVFATKSFPEIGDAKNAMAATHSSPNARGIIQIQPVLHRPLAAGEVSRVRSQDGASYTV